MAGRGCEIARRAKIRHPGRAEASVRPWLVHDPVKHFPVIFALPGRTKAVAGSEACTSATYVDHDERIAARHEQVAVPPRVRTGLAVHARVAEPETAIIGRENDDRREDFTSSRAVGSFRNVIIDRKRTSLNYGNVAGPRRLGCPITLATMREIVRRRYLP